MTKQKGGMTGYKKRRDLLDLSRLLLVLVFSYAIINGIGIVRFDINGMHTFLKWFNGTMMFGILFIILVLDHLRFNILNYGSIKKPSKRSA